MNKFLVMTNAVKAQVIAVINAFLTVLLLFGVTLSEDQKGAILLFVNAILALWVSLTYQYSHKRKAE
jgi:hypothetical protein